MPITPVDILHREFRKAFRGYVPSDVKAFQRELAEFVEQLLLENTQLKQEVERLRERLNYYELLEETLQNAIVLAQRAAEETKESAQRHAELIIDEAQGRAQRIIEDASRRASEVKLQITELKQERTRIAHEVKSLLEMMLASVNERIKQWERECEGVPKNERKEPHEELKEPHEDKIEPPILLAHAGGGQNTLERNAESAELDDKSSTDGS
ncbi:MAG: DivIVA domain-containing protein [Armatimonadota bacterium]|nr:DivIVA domain-containing protein [Armatimonadota bacterium]MDW8025608.1 DivIVA domain-containing protein [Armatimonadota bacterium]